MKNAHLQSSAKQLEMMAQGHDTNLNPSPSWDFQALAAAGGIKADLDDMIAYAQNQINLRNSQLYEKISLTHQSTFQGAPNGEIGLFWMKTNVQGKSFHWHNGQTGGYSSFMAFEKNRKIAIILLSNAYKNPTEVGMQ
ncbi:MAG: beta-lactamase family protein [Saprospiraceae bacterium]|nr:beta-lactamase family protein [Saprospiraceae bacterium]